MPRAYPSPHVQARPPSPARQRALARAASLEDESGAATSPAAAPKPDLPTGSAGERAGAGGAGAGACDAPPMSAAVVARSGDGGNRSVARPTSAIRNPRQQSDPALLAWLESHDMALFIEDTVGCTLADMRALTQADVMELLQAATPPRKVKATALYRLLHSTNADPADEPPPGKPTVSATHSSGADEATQSRSPAPGGEGRVTSPGTSSQAAPQVGAMPVPVDAPTHTAPCAGGHTLKVQTASAAQARARIAAAAVRRRGSAAW